MATYQSSYSGAEIDAAVAAAKTLDTSLSRAGIAADAKATGDAIREIEDTIYITITEWDSVEITLESGKYWSMTGTESSYANAKRSTNLIPVTAGQKLKITTRISTNIAGVVYFNSSTFSQATFVGYDLYTNPAAGELPVFTDEEVTVPVGATYVVVQGRIGASTPVGIKAPRDAFSPKYDPEIEAIDNKVDTYISDNDFEVANLQRRATNAEKANPFAWATFDKSYFVFIHDDTNEYLETYASVFHTKNEPMGAATIPSNINETHQATLEQIVEDGGEILGHYSASPTEESSDQTWYNCTGAVKKALEEKGFVVRGLIKANQTASSTNKGQKYCQLYYDYADNHLGKTTQFNLPRTLMLTFDSLAAFKARIDELENVNGIHAFGFHGGREDEAWITSEAMGEIIDYINGKSNCEITTYSALFDAFGSTVMAEKIKTLESYHT